MRLRIPMVNCVLACFCAGEGPWVVSARWVCSWARMPFLDGGTGLRVEALDWMDSLVVAFNCLQHHTDSSPLPPLSPTLPPLSEVTVYLCPLDTELPLRLNFCKYAVAATERTQYTTPIPHSVHAGPDRPTTPGTAHFAAAAVGCLHPAVLLSHARASTAAVGGG